MRKVDLKKWVWSRYQALPRALQGLPVLVAVSGGMDSSVLAAVSLELRERLPSLVWAHVNYRLRVPDSDREEASLRAWAMREGVPLRVRGLRPKQKPSNLQAWARGQRLDFFRSVAARLGGQGALLWMAHHQSDQAETILSRLLRGSGLKGIAGMDLLEQVEGLWIFRPFLEVPQAALRLYAQSHRLVFHHDRSNDTLDYLRNRIRHRLLPLMAEENPRILETLSQLGGRSREAAEALDGWAEAWLRRVADPGRGLPRQLSANSLRRQAPALRAAILERWLASVAGSRQSLGKILPALLQTIAHAKNQELPLKGGLRVSISPLWLRIGPRPAKPGKGRGGPAKSRRKAQKS
ncbi:MAG: tRNA lysidine(34) synthetase TilS [bacterium]